MANADTRDDGAAALQALGDPSRRAILGLLSSGEQAVGDLVARLDLSQPAVSQHLKVLLDAGLVDVRPEGRRRLYRASPDGLAAARDTLERLWRASLGEMREQLERPRRPRKEARDG